jgi:hypothetical protein
MPCMSNKTAFVTAGIAIGSLLVVLALLPPVPHAKCRPQLFQSVNSLTHLIPPKDLVLTNFIISKAPLPPTAR